MDFLEYYVDFKNLFKKWILTQSLCDILFIIVAVLSVIAGKTIIFIIAFIVFFIAEILVIIKLFGSLKGFGDYLNLRNKYMTASKIDNEVEIEKLEQEIIEYMKNGTA